MLEETRMKIEALGWHVIATKKHADGVSFDATDYSRLAHGGVFSSEDEAMESCLQAVLNG